MPDSLHLSLYIPNIYCQAMEFCDTSLKKKPYVLTQQSNDNQKSTIFAVSSLVKQKRIYPGYPLSLLMKKFPGIAVIPYKVDALELLKKDLISLAESFSPDSSFAHRSYLTLNLTGTLKHHHNSIETVVSRFLKEVEKRSLHTIQVAVGSAPMHTYLAARSPDLPSPYIPHWEREHEDILKLPAHTIPDLHFTTLKRLKQYNLYTLHDIKALSRSFISHHFKKDGEKLYAFTHGHILKKRTHTRSSSSITIEHILKRDTIHTEEQYSEFLTTLDALFFKMTKENAFSREFHLELEYADKKVSTSKKKSSHTIESFNGFKKIFIELFREIPVRRISLRVIRCSSLKVTRNELQLDLFSQDSPSSVSLEKSILKIRDKQGLGAIKTGAQLLNNEEITRRRYR
ncbi:MAG: hypothetical protein OCC49_12885 [Fibrobacterales bacterium]